MSEAAAERIEVTLGHDVGKKVFKDFAQARDWLNKERAFWEFFGNERHHSHESGNVWEPFNQCFRNLDEIFAEYDAAEEQAGEWRKRAEEANISKNDRELFLRRAEFDSKHFRERLAGTFHQHYHTNGLIPSSSPRAKFLASLAKDRGPAAALFACGYLMGTQIDYGTPDRLEGALAASYFEQGFTSRAPAEAESLSELRREWQDKFQQIQDAISAAADKQSALNSQFEAQQLKQQAEFATLLKKEQADWTALHKTYDEQLALAKPVRYWQKKAQTHRVLAWVFAGVSTAVVIAVFFLLFKFVQITLRPPEGLKDPAAWHPEYWRIGVLLAAGVFGVWVVRIVVRLFLSHVHLLADANERVTMANTYLSLHRSKQGLQEKDRQLILQVLFRPSSSGVVKDDGVPLSWIEAITKTGH